MVDIEKAYDGGRAHPPYSSKFERAGAPSISAPAMKNKWITHANFQCSCILHFGTLVSALGPRSILSLRVRLELEAV